MTLNFFCSSSQLTPNNSWFSPRSQWVQCRLALKVDKRTCSTLIGNSPTWTWLKEWTSCHVAMSLLGSLMVETLTNFSLWMLYSSPHVLFMFFFAHTDSPTFSTCHTPLHFKCQTNLAQISLEWFASFSHQSSTNKDSLSPSMSIASFSLKSTSLLRRVSCPFSIFDHCQKVFWEILCCLFILFASIVRPGSNILKRRSTESTVVIPFDRTFRNLDARPTGQGEDQFNFCGCGWWVYHFSLARKFENDLLSTCDSHHDSRSQARTHVVAEGNSEWPSLSALRDGDELWRWQSESRSCRHM